jgi:tRNA(Ile)-lysidine synthase
VNGSAAGLSARFGRAIGEIGPLPPASCLVIALSGGSDSVALLGLAIDWRERERPDLILVAGHLDHRLRGDESRGDAEFCRELCARLGVRAWIEEEDVAARAARERVSVETAGREARLAAFRRWAEREGARAVLTAHHRDDQVETILAHLCRGAGVGGLSGMAACRPLAPGLGTELWRPCLGFTREELSSHRTLVGLPHREDASNRSLGPARNRLRHRLLPLLRREANPAIDTALLALGAESREIAEAGRRGIAPFLPRLRIRPPHAAIPADAVRGVRDEPLLASALLVAAWSAAQGRPGALLRDHHLAWRRLIAGDGDARHYDLPRGAALERAGGWILLIGAAPPPDAALPPVVLPSCGEVAWRGATIRSGETADPAAGRDELIAALPDVPLAVRGARPGDRIRFSGFGHRVGEWLRAAGVPARWRGSYPVIIAAPEGGRAMSEDRGEGEEILWVPGVRGPSRGGGRLLRVTPVEGGDPISFLLALRGECSR